MSISRRELGRGVALAGVGLALGGCVAGASGVAPVAASGIDAASLIHPELRGVARVVQNMQVKEWNLDSLHEARGKEKPSAVLPGVPVKEMRIPVGGAAPDLTIFVVNAKPGTSRPGILYMHGGGFISGRAAGDIKFLQEFTQSLDCTIVSVDYRLAPETTWRGSVEDNYAGLKWLHDHAEELGVDRAKMAVMGGSAGGGHAALLAIAARDRGEVKLVFQSLTYPMLDDRTGSSRAVPSHIGTILWTPQGNRFGWESFLGMAPGGRDVPVAAVPARTANLGGLPPAWIGVGALDLFVDEDIEYARRLVNAGVATEMVVVPGAFHAFDFAPGVKVSQRFAAARIEALRQAFGA